MPTVLSIVLSLFGLFLLQRLLDVRRVVRDVGSVCLLSDLVDPELTRHPAAAIFLVHFIFSARPLLQAS